VSDGRSAIGAFVDICHSRPIAPTRRIAIGSSHLPFTPAPGLGGLLLAGIVSSSAPAVDPQLRSELVIILESLAHGNRIVQPRARHRLQTDLVGLTTSPQRLEIVDGRVTFKLEQRHASAVQLVLSAIYAAGRAPSGCRVLVIEAIRAALVWEQDLNQSFVSMIMGGQTGGFGASGQWLDPVGWALEVLEIEVNHDIEPGLRWRPSLVTQQFRNLLRQAHPDNGGEDALASRRISDLTEARRILLSS